MRYYCYRSQPKTNVDDDAEYTLPIGLGKCYAHRADEDPLP